MDRKVSIPLKFAILNVPYQPSGVHDTCVLIVPCLDNKVLILSVLEE